MYELVFELIFPLLISPNFSTTSYSIVFTVLTFPYKFSFSKPFFFVFVTELHPKNKGINTNSRNRLVFISRLVLGGMNFDIQICEYFLYKFEL